MPFVRPQELFDELAGGDRLGPGGGATTRSAPAAPPVLTRQQLPSWATGASGLDDLLLRRRSCRDFSPAAVPLPALTPIVASGLQTETAIWGRDAVDSRLTLLLIAYHVVGIAAGTYLFNPASASHWVPCRGPGPQRVPGWHGQFREVYAAAPVLLLVYGGVWQVHADLSHRGYARLLNRAGCLSYAAWLAATGQGLGCCVFGRAHPAAACFTPGAGQTALRQLATLAIGYPRAADSRH